MLAFDRRRGLVSSVATLVVLSLTSPSFVLAQASEEPASDSPSGDQEARAHFESARLYFDRGEYEQALREFETAYELSGRAGLLYNIYLTLERLGRYGEAADRLDQFLGDEAAVEPDRRPGLESRVANLRERARLEASREAPDDPPPPDDGDRADDGLGGLGIAGAVTLGVGAASLVTFAIVGGVAVGEDASLASRCGRDAGRTCTEQEVSTLRTLTTTADVMLTVGVVLAAAGGAMLAVDVLTGNDESEQRVRWAPMVGPDVAGIVIGGSL